MDKSGEEQLRLLEAVFAACLSRVVAALARQNGDYDIFHILQSMTSDQTIANNARQIQEWIRNSDTAPKSNAGRQGLDRRWKEKVWIKFLTRALKHCGLHLRLVVAKTSSPQTEHLDLEQRTPGEMILLYVRPTDTFMYVWYSRGS
jgi:hypothetical protein